MADDFGAFESDPTADFLAREQAMLGDDAQFFNADGSTPVVDIPAAPPAQVLTNPPAADADFGNFETITPIQATPVISQMNTFLPATTNQAIISPVKPVEEIQAENTSNDANIFEKKISEVDVQNSLFVKESIEKRNKIIEERDAKNASKHNEMLTEAKNSIDKFYSDYNQKKNKTLENNRIYEQKNKVESDNSSPLTWNNVCTKIDFNSNAKASKEKNVDRFKDLLLDLSKSNESIKTN